MEVVQFYPVETRAHQRTIQLRVACYQKKNARIERWTVLHLFETVWKMEKVYTTQFAMRACTVDKQVLVQQRFFVVDQSQNAIHAGRHHMQMHPLWISRRSARSSRGQRQCKCSSEKLSMYTGEADRGF